MWTAEHIQKPFFRRSSDWAAVQSGWTTSWLSWWERPSERQMTDAGGALFCWSEIKFQVALFGVLKLSCWRIIISDRYVPEIHETEFFEVNFSLLIDLALRLCNFIEIWIELHCLIVLRSSRSNLDLWTVSGILFSYRWTIISSAENMKSNSLPISFLTVPCRQISQHVSLQVSLTSHDHHYPSFPHQHECLLPQYPRLFPIDSCSLRVPISKRKYLGSGVLIYMMMQNSPHLGDDDEPW